VNPTATLARAIASSDRVPTFVAQNGTSYYGDRGDEELREDSGTAPGSLLTEVTREWQEVTEPATEAGARVVVLRTAPVMHPRALTFRLLRTVFKTGLAGPLGDGRQYFPLISLQDWLRAATFLLERDASAGPYNLSIPEPCTNAEFTEALAEAVHRPARIPVPAFAIRKAAGRLSGELLGSARIVPAGLLQDGFDFDHPDVRSVLAYALRR